MASPSQAKSLRRRSPRAVTVEVTVTVLGVQEAVTNWVTVAQAEEDELVVDEEVEEDEEDEDEDEVVELLVGDEVDDEVVEVELLVLLVLVLLVLELVELGFVLTEGYLQRLMR